MNTKVLFVDDEVKILSSFTRNLAEVFDVATASSGKEGLQVLSDKGPFAAVVSDLKMPDMDGIEFLGQVRKTFPDTIRVMLTGFADLEPDILGAAALSNGEGGREPGNVRDFLGHGVRQGRVGGGPGDAFRACLTFVGCAGHGQSLDS